MAKRLGMLALGVCLVIIGAAPRDAAAQGVIKACVQRSSQQVRIIQNTESCRATEIPVEWNIAGSPGPAGPTGPEGPEGPSGPAGADGLPGMTLVAEARWRIQTAYPCCLSWTTVRGSETSGVTNGGTLVIVMDLTVTGGNNTTCRPVIDGEWAGAAGGQDTSRTNGMYWVEGMIYTGGAGWKKWAPTRVFHGVPAGSHAFWIECTNDSGTGLVNDHGDTYSSYSSWAIFEIP